jgi:hypothetical protein
MDRFKPAHDAVAEVFCDVEGRHLVQRANAKISMAGRTLSLSAGIRRLGRRKSMPFGVYSRTLRTLRAMCDPIERVPPHGAWLWRLRDDVAARWR